jgi:hypothetical protein
MPLISACLHLPLLFSLFFYQTSSTTTFVVLNLKERGRKKIGMQYYTCYCVLCSFYFILLTLFYTTLHGV